jgi:hypothetical protein
MLVENSVDRAAVFLQQRLDFAVSLFGINVVGADQIEFLPAQGIDDPGHEIVELLVRNGPGIEAVLAAFLGFVQRRIKQHAVILFEDRQHRLTAGRGITAEHGCDLVLEQELFRFFGENLHHRLRVLDDRLKLLAEHTAFGVDLFDRQQFGIVQRRLDDRDRAAQRVEDANLDGVAFRRLGDVSHKVVGGDAACENTG